LLDFCILMGSLGSGLIITSFFGVWFLYNMLMCVIMVLLYYNLVYNRKKFTLKSPVLNFQTGF